MIKTIYDIMNRFAILIIFMVFPFVNFKLFLWLFSYYNINTGWFMGTQVVSFIFFYGLYIMALHYLEKRIENEN